VLFVNKLIAIVVICFRHIVRMTKLFYVLIFSFFSRLIVIRTIQLSFSLIVIHVVIHNNFFCALLLVFNFVFLCILGIILTKFWWSCIQCSKLNETYYIFVMVNFVVCENIVALVVCTV